ncbi:methyltransferase [Crangon crangon nudivirus]|uniref:Methyltransferase n=1 Tax=Crangon crangon nudivirus TaxID=2880838 RepID=A0AAE8Y0H1_9VIRU|nr:methyltransferase [Crangon crangon nudivirus]UBZ25486.1 methyltransferase [Crangon crangon nudivirus]
MPKGRRLPSIVRQIKTHYTTRIVSRFGNNDIFNHATTSVAVNHPNTTYNNGLNHTTTSVAGKPPTNTSSDSVNPICPSRLSISDESYSHSLDGTEASHIPSIPRPTLCDDDQDICVPGPDSVCATRSVAASDIIDNVISTSISKTTSLCIDNIEDVPYSMGQVGYTKENTYKPDVNSKLIFDTHILKIKLNDIPKNMTHIARSNSDKFNKVHLPPMCKNRAGLKLLEINATLDQPLLKLQDNWRIGDLCCSPGGFAYLIRKIVELRRLSNIEYHGLTIEDPDIPLYEIIHKGIPNRYIPHITLGDIYDPAVWIRFKPQHKLELILADGGKSVVGIENDQEGMHHNLYITQAIVALANINVDGTFICKYFDIYHKFTADLIYLLSQCFKTVSVIKPKTSRSANSERYIVYRHYQDTGTPIHDYLLQVYQRFSINRIVTSIVPQLYQDEQFCNWYDSHLKRLRERQIESLQIYLDESKWTDYLDYTNYTQNHIKAWIAKLY